MPLFSLMFRKYKPVVFGLLTREDFQAIEGKFEDVQVSWLVERTQRIYDTFALANKAHLQSLHLYEDMLPGMLSGFEVEFASAVDHTVIGNALRLLLQATAPDFPWTRIIPSGSYHAHKREIGVWHVERDASISLDYNVYTHSVELVMPPVAVEHAISVLPLLFALVQACGKVTRSCGLHFTVSHPKINLKYDALGLISEFDAGPVLESFGRSDNSYCKNHKIDTNAFEPDTMLHYAAAGASKYGSRTSDTIIGSSRTLAINFSNLQACRVELRAMGGADYPTKFPLVADTALSFARAAYQALDSSTDSRYQSARKVRSRLGAAPRLNKSIKTHEFSVISDVVGLLPPAYLVRIATTSTFSLKEAHTLTATDKPRLILCSTATAQELAFSAFGIVIPVCVHVGLSGLTLLVDAPRGRPSNIIAYVRCLTWLKCHHTELFAEGVSVSLAYTDGCLKHLTRSKSVAGVSHAHKVTTIQRIYTQASAGMFDSISLDYTWNPSRGVFGAEHLDKDVLTHMPLVLCSTSYAKATLLDSRPVSNYFAEIPSSGFSSISAKHVHLFVSLAAKALADGAEATEVLAELTHRSCISGWTMSVHIEALGSLRAVFKLRLPVSAAIHDMAISLVLVFLAQETDGGITFNSLKQYQIDRLSSSLLSLYKQLAKLTMRLGRSLKAVAATERALEVVYHGTNLAFRRDQKADVFASTFSVPCIKHENSIMSPHLFDYVNILVTSRCISADSDFDPDSTARLTPAYLEFILRQLCGNQNRATFAFDLLNRPVVLYTKLLREYLHTGDTRVYRALLYLPKILAGRLAQVAIISLLNELKTPYKVRATFYVRCAYGALFLPKWLPSPILFARSLISNYCADSFWSISVNRVLRSSSIDDRTFYLNGTLIPTDRVVAIMSLVS